MREERGIGRQRQREKEEIETVVDRKKKERYFKIEGFEKGRGTYI